MLASSKGRKPTPRRWFQTIRRRLLTHSFDTSKKIHDSRARTIQSPAESTSFDTLEIRTEPSSNQTISRGTDCPAK